MTHHQWFSAMESALVIIGSMLLALAVMSIVSIITIWALNTLFRLEISYGILEILATVWMLSAAVGTGKTHVTIRR